MWTQSSRGDVEDRYSTKDLQRFLRNLQATSKLSNGKAKTIKPSKIKK